MDGRTHDDELGDDFTAVVVDMADDLKAARCTGHRRCNLAVLPRFHLVGGHHTGDDDGHAGAAICQFFIHFGQIFCRHTIPSHSFKSSRTDNTAVRFNTADARYQITWSKSLLGNKNEFQFFFGICYTIFVEISQ